MKMKIFSKWIALQLILFVQLNYVLAKNNELIFSHTRGFYSDPFDLIISINVDDAKIKYTLNGGDPRTSSSTLIENNPAKIEINPLNFSNRDVAPGFIVTATAFVGDSLICNPVTHTYLFVDKITELSRDNFVPGNGWLAPGTSPQEINYGLDPDIYNNTSYSSDIKEAFLSIPSMSLVTDLDNLFDPGKGIYVNALKHGRDWERPASLELINPDGSEGFQINCGIRIRGGWSRNSENPKHAFRFFFRSEYGKGKLNYPLFGDEGTNQFDKIDLRTSQNYSWSFTGDSKNTFLRDVFSRDTQRDMHQPYTRSRYYHLFINGTYWGLYQTQERSEASYAAEYFDGQREDYDVIKVDVGENFNRYHIEATDGTVGKWRELWELGEQGFSDNEVYLKAQGLDFDGSLNPDYDKLLDIDNLIDYMIVTLFVGDFDGPISNFRGNESPNNFYAIFNRVNPDGFKFFRHDAEHTLFLHDWGIDRTGPFPAGQNFLDSNPQWIHQKLSENAQYRFRFADRIYKHFFNNGVLTYQRNIARLEKRKSQIETAIIAESARWGDSKVQSPKTKRNWNNEINFIKYTFLPNRVNTLFEQLINKGLFSDNLPPQFSIVGGIVQKGSQLELSVNTGKIYYTFDGSDPFTPFTSSENNFSKDVVSPSTAKKVFVPKSAISDGWYTSNDFNDDNWQDCNGNPGGIGYESDTGYEQYITLDLEEEMKSGGNPNTSCFIRIPFIVNSNELEKVTVMKLSIMCDDGFAAYINGVEVARFNAQTTLTWNSSSVSYEEANNFLEFDISQYVSLLNEGENLLALHGLNYSTVSSDFLILPKLNLSNSSLHGAISDNAIEYTSPIELNETVTVKTRSLNETNWSMLNESRFIIDEDLSNLKLTELHYHPLDRDSVDGREFEFIEMKNVGNVELNLSYSTFVDGINFMFSPGTIVQPNEFILIVSDKTQFEKRYELVPNGEYQGQLDNAGETIALENAAGTKVFSFTYYDKTPWPEKADGEGYSLVSYAKSGWGNPNNAEYWVRSSSIHGSPGEDDLVSSIRNGEQNNVPLHYKLNANYPNPFNPTTVITFQLAESGATKLEVFNILGELVSLEFNKHFEKGKHEYKLSMLDASSGLYIYRLSSGKFSSSKKMILLK